MVYGKKLRLRNDYRRTMNEKRQNMRCGNPWKVGVMLMAGVLVLGIVSAKAGQEGGMDTTVYSFSAETIDGQARLLEQYKGKVLLIVNTASKCGFTDQYSDLEALYKTYNARGFEILAFPSNDFLFQEPGSNEEIKNFCETKFHTTFDLFAKIKVKGKEAHPLYQWLVNQQTYGGEISWNFNKFLIDRNGHVIARFSSRVNPQAPEVIRAVEDALREQTKK
jgi:glutathione peroxidase